MKNPIFIYLISGKAQTGKGEAGKYLQEEYQKRGYQVCEIQMMRTLKGYLKDYFGWDGKEETKPRRMLQEMGTELIRERLGLSTFHIDRLTEDIQILSNYFSIFIVNDIRLPLEIEEMKKRFPHVVTIHIEKENYQSPLTEQEASHSTEHALENYHLYDYEICNNSLEKLKQDMKQIVDCEEMKNEIHD